MEQDDTNKHLDTITCCHYTNKKGLLGILKSQCIFATDFRCLNDSKEFIWAKELLLPVIMDIITENITDSTINPKLIDAEANRFLNIMYQPLNSKLPLFLVCSSLHEEQNNDGLLTMWRAYGKPNDCIGIIFDATKNEESKEICYKNLTAGDRSQIKSAIRDPISKWMHGKKSHKLYEAINTFLGIVTRYKHFGFSDEREFRLIFCENDRPIKTRIKNNRIMHYIEIPFPHNEIKGIIVGPCDRQEKIRDILLLHPVLQNQNIPIHLSSIPFIWD